MPHVCVAVDSNDDMNLPQTDGGTCVVNVNSVHTVKARIHYTSFPAPSP